MSRYPKDLKIFTAIAVIFWTAFTFARHMHFQTQAWDMGIFDQLFWNTINGDFMKSSLEEIPNHFGIHFSPTLLLLVPFYYLVPSPYTLLFLQSLVLMIGVFPLFSIAKRRLPDPFPVIIAAGYLLSPSLHWIATYDFHEIAFFIPLFLFAWNFMEEKNILLSGIFFALAAGTKEDAILAVLFAGIAVAILNWKIDFRLKNFGLLVSATALIYFLIVINILMPAFGGGLLRLDRYSHFGNSGGEIIRNILTNPLLVLNTVITSKKLSYIFWLLIPLAGTALFSPTGLMLLLPGLTENLLTNFSAQFSGNYQYDAILLPGIFISAIYGISGILKSKPNGKFVLKDILILAIGISYLLRSPINPVFFPFETFQSTPVTDSYSELIENVPENVSVSASTNLVPHLSRREKISVLGSEAEPADIILADAGDLFGFKDQKDFESYLDSYLISGIYDFGISDGRYIKLIKKELLR